MNAPPFEAAYLARLTERLVLLSVSFLALVPVQQLFVVPFVGGALNPFELAYVLIFFFLFLRALLRVRMQHAKPFFLSAGLLILYVAVQLGLGMASMFSIVRQLRYFFPFVLATLVFAVGLNHLNLKKTLYYLAIASSISAVSSLVLYFFFQDFLIRAIRHSTTADVAAHFELLLKTGRSQWGNSALVFTSMLTLGYLPAFSRRKRRLIQISAALSIIAALATLSRTTMIGIFLIAVFAPLAYYASTAKRLTYYLRMSMVAMVLGAGVVVLSLTNKQFGQGLAVRFAINVGVSHVVDTAIKGNRDLLYEEYMKRITSHFPIGQGLGKPYAVLPQRGAYYTTDVSILSFLLPFGVPGVLILFGFLFHVYSYFRTKSSDPDLERFRRMLLLVFMCTLIISLNIDLFSRNNFVVYLSIIAIAYANTARIIKA